MVVLLLEGNLSFSVGEVYLIFFFLFKDYFKLVQVKILSICFLTLCLCGGQVLHSDL